jgi:hypothetical protein
MREVYVRVAFIITGNNVFGAGIKAVITAGTFFAKQGLTNGPRRTDFLYPASDISV